MPKDENVTFPGLARTQPMNSFSVFAGTEGCTDSRNGESTSFDNGWKSRIGSNGSFACNAVFEAKLPIVPSSSV